MKPTTTEQFKCKKIYLSSLPSTITENSLRNYFSEYGKVIEIDLSRNLSQGFCRGFGSITFTNDADIRSILNTGHVLMGRTINCDQFLESKGALDQKKEEVKKRRVFISNIPSWMNNSYLKKIMERFGPVNSAYKIQKYGSGKIMPYGYVFFENDLGAQLCLERGFVFNGEQDGFMLMEPYTKDKRIRERMRNRRKIAIKEFQNQGYEHQGPFMKKELPSYPQRNIVDQGGRILGNLGLSYEAQPVYLLRGNVEQDKAGVITIKKPIERLSKKVKLEKEKRRRQLEFNNLKPFQKKYWEFSLKRKRYFNSDLEENIRFNKHRRYDNDD